MNRRGFLQFLGMATVGAGVAYSFPNIIVPNNIEVVSSLDIIDLVTKREIYPELIKDIFFQENAFFVRMRISDSSQYGFGFSNFKSDPEGKDAVFDEENNLPYWYNEHKLLPRGTIEVPTNIA